MVKEERALPLVAHLLLLIRQKQNDLLNTNFMGHKTLPKEWRPYRIDKPILYDICNSFQVLVELWVYDPIVK